MDNRYNQENREWSSRGGRESGGGQRQGWQRNEREGGQRWQRNERKYDGYRGGRGYGRGGRGRGEDYRQFDVHGHQNYQDNRGGYRNPNYVTRGGFGRPPHHVQNYQSNEYDYGSAIDDSQRSRPRSKHSADHRDASPDRNDRARNKDRLNEDHTRDASPDRSSNEQYRQDGQIQWDNSQNQTEYTNIPSSSQGQQGPGSGAYNMHTAQGFDNYNQEYGGKWNQGQEGYSKGYRNENYGRQDYNRHDRYGRSLDNYQEQQYGEKGGEYQRDRRQRNWEENDDFRLSKALSFLLRHGAERQGYKLMPGGFLYVDEILKKQKNLMGYTLEDIQRIVKVNDKQRFYMETDKETGKWKIRANQGHTVQVDDLDLKPLVSKDEAPIVIHGTYMASWEKIKHTGLSRMGRNHIHFAAGEPGENGVISGMRSSCEVMIFIDIEKALKDGFKFFRSANNVILCAGDKDGVIPPAYFENVVQRYPRQRLEFDKDVELTKIPIGGAGLAPSGKDKKKKKKKGKKDKEHEEGTESKAKKEKMEVDEDAVESAAGLYDDDENMETDDKLAQGPIKQVKNKWDDDEDEFKDAVQDQDDFHDAEDDSPDVCVESTEETILIDEMSTCISAVDYLKGCEVVAVQCTIFEGTITRIACAGKDKCYNFDLMTSPEIMTDGKLAEFFNFNKDTVKVFHRLDSHASALFFEKFGIMLDGTKIFDLKLAFDLMTEKGAGNLTELNQTGYNSEFIPSDDSNLYSLLQTYLKAYAYLSKEMQSEKDYKRDLFQMVNEDIDKAALKTVRDQRKKDSKGKGKGKKN